MNRLNRDQILHRALDMLDAPSLNSIDRPGGVFESDALSIGWLQDGLDYFHHEFPWQGTVKSTSLTLGSSGTVALPTDFILEVKDAVITSKGRLERRGLQEIIDLSITHPQAGDPGFYVVVTDALRYHPVPSGSVAATLWYYALPAVLGPTQVPAFPVDWVLVEFVRLRGLEWLRLMGPNTAHTYAQDKCKELKTAGLAGEPERTKIPFDRQTWRPQGTGDSYAWMGDTVPK